MLSASLLLAACGGADDVAGEYAAKLLQEAN